MVLTGCTLNAQSLILARAVVADRSKTATFQPQTSSIELGSEVFHPLSPPYIEHSHPYSEIVGYGWHSQGILP
jgi:hypothetical protein